MSWLGEHKFLKDRARKNFAGVKIPKIDSSSRKLIFAGIQVTGGAGLAVYTHEKGTYGFWPIMFSAIAVGGTYSFIKTMQWNEQISRFPFLKRYRVWSSWDMASGTLSYSTGVYAFSECFKRDDLMWIPCLALAASGYYFIASSVDSLDRFANRTPFLKCCQLMFEPVVLACTATYLFYFHNHKEGWLKGLPFAVISATGYKIVHRGCLRDGSVRNILLIKMIELFMGSCFLSISSTTLAIYSSANDLFWPLTAFMSTVSLYGFFITFGSLLCLRQYIDMDRRVFFSTVGMIVGPVNFSSAFLMIECVEDSDIVHPAFLILTGTGQCILYTSLYQLYKRVPRQVFNNYCERVCGPVLAVYSSMISAYVAYRMGWRLSLLSVPFIPAGIYATYRGYRKEKRSSKLLPFH